MKLTLKQIAARITKRALNTADEVEANKLNTLAAEILGLEAQYPTVGRLDLSTITE